MRRLATAENIGNDAGNSVAGGEFGGGAGSTKGTRRGASTVTSKQSPAPEVFSAISETHSEPRLMHLCVAVKWAGGIRESRWKFDTENLFLVAQGMLISKRNKLFWFCGQWAAATRFDVAIKIRIFIAGSCVTNIGLPAVQLSWKVSTRIKLKYGNRWIRAPRILKWQIKNCVVLGKCLFAVMEPNNCWTETLQLFC